jgi:hypothetical protein
VNQDKKQEINRIHERPASEIKNKKSEVFDKKELK